MIEVFKDMMVKVILVLILGIAAGCGRHSSGLQSQKEITEEQKSYSFSGPEPEQALEEYTFSGFSEGTNRRWEVRGRAAEVFGEFIKMFDVQAKAFGEEGTITVTTTAKEGKMYTGSNNVRMEKDVVIATPDGATLTTDYLDWVAQTETVTTEAYVVVQKDNIVVEGQGAEGKTNLKKVKVKEKVKVTVHDQGEDSQLPTIITCDGKLEIDYENNVAKFFDNVVLDDQRGKVFADRMDIYIDPKTKTVIKAIAEGNVKIEEPTKVSYCQKAIYDRQIKKITLLGSPKVIIYPGKGEEIAPFGN